MKLSHKINYVQPQTNTHYIHHEKFCNVCMERKVIATGISIKNKPSISLWKEEFIADWKIN